MSVVIREAWLTDLPLIEGKGDAFRDGWSRKQLSQELERERGALLVAQVDGRHAGHAIAWEVAGETHILDVHVEPWARRRGLGRALVDHLMEACGRGLALLEVHEENEGAIALYAALGFVEAGRRPRYYSDGCDAVLMNLEPS